MAELVNDPTVPGPVLMNEDFNGYGTGEANVGRRARERQQRLPRRRLLGPHVAALQPEVPLPLGRRRQRGRQRRRRGQPLPGGARTAWRPAGSPTARRPRSPRCCPPRRHRRLHLREHRRGFSEPMAPARLDRVRFAPLARRRSGGRLASASRRRRRPRDAHADAPAAAGRAYSVDPDRRAGRQRGQPADRRRLLDLHDRRRPRPAPARSRRSGTRPVRSRREAALGQERARPAHDWVAGQSPPARSGGALFAGPDSGIDDQRRPARHAADAATSTSPSRRPAPTGSGCAATRRRRDNSVSVSLDGLHPKDLESREHVEPGARRMDLVRRARRLAVRDHQSSRPPASTRCRSPCARTGSTSTGSCWSGTPSETTCGSRPAPAPAPAPGPSTA